MKQKNKNRKVLKELVKALLTKLLGDTLGALLFEQFKDAGVSVFLVILLVISIAGSIYWLPSLYQKAVELSAMFPGEVAVSFITPPADIQSTKEPLDVRVQIVSKSNHVILPIAPSQIGIFQEPSEELAFDQTIFHLDSEEFKATSLEPSEYQVFAKFIGTSKLKPARSGTFKFVLYDEPSVEEAKAWKPIFRESADLPSQQLWFTVHPKVGQNLSQVLQITPQRDTDIKDTPFIWYQRPVKFPCEIGFTMRPLAAGAQLAVSLNDQLVFLIDTESQFRVSAWERDLSSMGAAKRLALESDGQQQESALLPLDIRSAEERYTRVEMRLSRLKESRYKLAVTMLGVAPGKDATTEFSFVLSEPLPQKGVVGLGASRMSRGVEIGDLHLYAVRDTLQSSGEGHTTQ
jgi:hypothetical protein